MVTTTHPAAPTLTRRRAETRDRLMDAAILAFAERGVLGASVEEISERAGFTRGAFYSNFGSKDELVLALLNREAEVQIGHARRAIRSVLTVPPESEAAASALIDRTVEVFFGAQGTDREWLVAQRELRLYAIRNPAVSADFVAFDEQCRDELVSLLSDALVSAGRAFTIPVDQALTIVIAVFEHTVLQTLTVGPGVTGPGPREVMTTVLTAITRTAPEASP